MRRDVQGLVYLLHFDQPYRHARHYRGFAERNVKARIKAHKEGRGARLMAVIKQAGIGFTVAKVEPGTRARERQLKQRGAGRDCPVCKDERTKENDMAVPYELTERGREAAEAVDYQLTEKGEKEAGVATLGDLVVKYQRGDIGRDTVKAAIAELDVIAWSAPVREPEISDDGLEMGA